MKVHIFHIGGVNSYILVVVKMYCLYVKNPKDTVISSFSSGCLDRILVSLGFLPTLVRFLLILYIFIMRTTWRHWANLKTISLSNLFDILSLKQIKDHVNSEAV
jgi:hypothetical protein